MSKLGNIQIASLKLDLSNYRTVPQETEIDSINAIIAISPDRFWALMENIVEDGYYPTDNIIIYTDGNELIVKEGNRRIAALKIILGYINEIEIPSNIKAKIDTLDDEWKKSNSSIPCVIYEKEEIETAKKMVSLVHGKGEKAGREKWTAVAKARYNRDEKNKKETSLDLLEKYLTNGKNLTSNQKECWGGDYPITILDDLLSKLYFYFNYQSSDELVKKYPSENRITVEKILYDIGIGSVGFKEIRQKSFLEMRYGITKKETTDEKTVADDPFPLPKSSGTDSLKGSTMSSDDTNEGETSSSVKTKPKKTALPLTDPKTVKNKLRLFKLKGENRGKVASLLEEIRKLNIETHPFSFCFLLRSMFEISAKAYCLDHKESGLSSMKPDGNEKEIANLLRDIVTFMAPDKKKDKEKLKLFHGALTELDKKDSILSFTTLNQLIHNPRFSILSADICMLFHNIFPLLEEMNS